MTPREWLRLMCSYNPGLERRAPQLTLHATRLAAEFPARAFDAATARAAAKHLGDQPTYADIATALRHAMPDGLPADRSRSEEQIVADSWDRYALVRLREGGDPAHLLSLIRTHAPRDAVAGIIARHWPEAAEEERRHQEDVMRDKARVAHRVGAVRRAMAPPALPKASALPPPEAPRAPPVRALDAETLADARRAAGIPVVEGVPA